MNPVETPHVPLRWVSLGEALPGFLGAHCACGLLSIWHEAGPTNGTFLCPNDREPRAAAPEFAEEPAAPPPPPPAGTEVPAPGGPSAVTNIASKRRPGPVAGPQDDRPGEADQRTYTTRVGGAQPYARRAAVNAVALDIAGELGPTDALRSDG